MAIDLLTEKLMPLTAVPAFLESRGIVPRSGKSRVVVHTVQQWVKSGKLEATPRVAGVQHTSEEALARMLMGEGGSGGKAAAGSKQPRRHRTRRDQERAHEAAMERLREQGVL